MKNSITNNKPSKSLKMIAYFAAAISLVVTPWFNKESITIPKFILLTIVTSYLVPSLFQENKLLIKSKTIKVVLILQFLIIVQLVLVVAISPAPLEQQIFGRSGRLLGFITYLCLIILFIASIRYINILKNMFILKTFTLVGCIIAIYAIMQSFGFDFMRWDTRTNAVISTL